MRGLDVFSRSNVPAKNALAPNADALARIVALEDANEDLIEANRRLRLDNQMLRRLAYIDPLTGLGNRRYFETHLDIELRRAARNHESLGLILCDIDDFKACNDRYGHPTGDLVLIFVADRLRTFCRRAGDLATRHGGDEFAVILPDLRPEALFSMSDRLRRSIKSPDLGQLETIGPVTVSIGAACLANGLSCSAAALIATADAALYRAKRIAGKDSVRTDVLRDARQAQSRNRATTE
jgi:diguanylate cyclase (GGDEF)-like protein